MRRLLAVILVLVFLPCAFADAEEDLAIFSYDFDLRFHLDAGLFPFRQREHMQGYADLLEMLEFRGNISYCPETDCSDLYIDVIPLTNPKAAISFHIWGIPIMHRVTSALLADKALCFNPGAFLGFSISARESFQVPLPYLILMNPRTTISAFSSLSGIWKDKTGEMEQDGIISVDTLKEIAKAWKTQMESKTKISYWAEALVDPSQDDGLALQDLKDMPQQLLNVAGNKPLTVMRDNETMTITSDSGFLLWEQIETENTKSYALHIPENAARYFPVFFAREKTEDGRTSFVMNIDWECAEETAIKDPATGFAEKRLEFSVTAEGLPTSLPMETQFSGTLTQKGFLLPIFSYLMSGSTTMEGRVQVTISSADKPEAGMLFSCEGTVTPSTHPEPMAYEWTDLSSDYNILNLSYAAQGEMIDAIKEPLILGMIDFLYELPISSCQSFMDDLENSGVLRTVLK